MIEFFIGAVVGALVTMVIVSYLTLPVIENLRECVDILNMEKNKYKRMLDGEQE